MGAEIETALRRVETDAGIVFRVAGEGRPLVLFHGGAGCWRHWQANIDALSPLRTLLIPDLPGFGESAGVPPEITLDDYVGLVGAAIEEICGKEETVDILGFSFGGQIAAGCAARLGRRAGQVALLSPSGFEAAEGRVLKVPRRRDFDQTEAGEMEFHRRMLLAIMLADPASVDATALDIQRYSAAHDRFDRRHISRAGRLLSLLGEIAAPLLLLYGDRDVIAYPSPEHRIALCRGVRPDLDAAIVAGAGHWLQYERAEEANRLLGGFFGKGGA